jgi:hypothetical protein
VLPIEAYVQGTRNYLFGGTGITTTMIILTVLQHNFNKGLAEQKSSVVSRIVVASKCKL